MLEEQLRALLELYGEQFIKDIREKMAEDGSVASGSANASLSHLAESTSLLILGNAYIEQVSEGRRPGSISEEGFKRIQDWVKVKGLNPDRSRGVLRYKDIAFVVARKIRNSGFAGTGLFQYVIDKNIIRLSEDVAQVVLETVGKQLDQVISASFAPNTTRTI